MTFVVFILMLVIRQVIFVNTEDCRTKENLNHEFAVNCDFLKLTLIPSMVRFGLNPIKFISISGDANNLNNIPTIRKTDFQAVSRVTSLVISWSQVKTVEDGAFEKMADLKTLSLTDNELESLNATTFAGIPLLKELDLSGNRICKFDETIFNNIQSISVLNLGDMNLLFIREDFFNSLHSLRVLKLYTNHIKTVSENLILNLPALENLDLSANQLQTIPVEWKPKFQTMKRVHLVENPLHCNCLLAWLQEQPYQTTLDSGSLVCNGPQKLRYSSFLNVPDRDFVCIPPKVLHCEQSTYSVGVNQQLSIVCEYGGDPVPEIKWTRPDGQVYDGRNTSEGGYHVAENGTLLIYRVLMSDNGLWKVTAYNQTTSDNMLINVIVRKAERTEPQTIPPIFKPEDCNFIHNEAAISSTVPVIKISKILEKGSPKADVATAGIDMGNIYWVLLAAIASAAGAMVGLLCLLIMFCKRNKKPNRSNQIRAFEHDI
ncbi:leucine-rich repeat and fibronectin type-III domain-containing protein 5-like [Dreissena polymorpha]|uniref:Ig-like domain-containing protein n=1 Tax=Dreissena polymorpha TaxID=45954 RepID=A0A9D4KPP1_DREPO|nr:leucine-rich repeat and fibronectin type-III domain-containing protein 5-like [Dreissena polymorpha]KAH3843742.1 hypothetical protein DPMN_117272 [Dreissena polymorpha]